MSNDTKEQHSSNDVEPSVSETVDNSSAECDDVEELYEMEIAEEDIYAYLMDENDNEIGFVLLDENGVEQNYFYADLSDYEIVESIDCETPSFSENDEDDDYDLGITREGVSEFTDDLNAIYKDGSEIVTELKETVDDITEGIGFLNRKSNKAKK